MAYCVRLNTQYVHFVRPSVIIITLSCLPLLLGAFDKVHTVLDAIVILKASKGMVLTAESILDACLVRSSLQSCVDPS